MILSLFITKFWRHSWTHRLWKTTIWENGRQSFHNNSHFINFRVLVSNFHILFTKSLLKVLMICQLSLFIKSTFLILLISQRSLVFDTLALSSLCKLRFCSTICCFQSPCILWPHNTDGEVIHIHGEHVHDLCHVEVALIETSHCGNCHFHAFLSKAPVFGSSYKSTELLALFFLCRTHFSSWLLLILWCRGMIFCPTQYHRAVVRFSWWGGRSWPRVTVWEHGPVTTIKISAIIKRLSVCCLWWNQYNIHGIF